MTRAATRNRPSVSSSAPNGATTPPAQPPRAVGGLSRCVAQGRAGSVGITGTWVQMAESPLHKAASLHSSFLFAGGDSEAHVSGVVRNETKCALGGGSCSAKGGSRDRRRRATSVSPCQGGKPRLQEGGQRHGGAGSAPGRRPGTSLPAQPLSHLDSVKRLRASLRGPVSATGRG